MNEGPDRGAIASALKRHDSAPPFGDAFARAHQSYRRRRVRRLAAGIAATLVVSFAVVGLHDRATPDVRYIEMAELLESTRWQAPSDALLPDYSARIYDEVPAIPVSTEPAEGALL